MARLGLAVCATADRPSLDPAEDVDPDVGGHRDKGHPQPGRDEEEIDGLNKIVLLRREHISISSYYRVRYPEAAVHGKSFETLLSQLIEHSLASVTLESGHADKEDY